MKDNLGDIEKLFSETFESFEADVDPKVWNNISNNIGQSPVQDPSSSVASSTSSSGGASGFAGLGVAKIAAIVGTAGILSVGGYYMLSGEEQVESPKIVETEIVEVESADVSASEKIIIEDELSVVEQASSDENTSSEKEVVVSSKVESTSEIATQEEIQTNIGDEIISEEQPNESDEVIASENKIAAQTPKKESLPVENDELSPEEEIVLLDRFEASIYASVKSGTQPLEVSFENIGSDSKDILWDFRDGSMSNAPNEYHTFEKSGDHWVILKITHEDGRISKDSVKITVNGKAYIKAHNTFSPNGDGINDAFMVESDYVDTFICKIFDRNQREVYSWDSVYGHWGGNDKNNNPLPEGVYFFVIDATDMDGNPLKRIKGTVTLFR